MAERVPNEEGRGFDSYEAPLQSENRDNVNSFADSASDRERSEEENKSTAIRGFAAMDREKQKRIASEGGRAAHRQGVAHEWSKDEARAAGRKGGQTVSRNREYMSEIGRRGGQNSGLRRQQSGE